MLVDIGLEFYSASSISWGMTLRSRSQKFHIKVKKKIASKFI